MGCRQPYRWCMCSSVYNFYRANIEFCYLKHEFYPPLRLRTCQTACAVVPPAVLAFIVWTRLQTSRTAPADPMQEAGDDLGQVAVDEPGQLAEDDPMQEGSDELANLEILLLTLCAHAAALLTASWQTVIAKPNVTEKLYVEPRDQT